MPSAIGAKEANSIDPNLRDQLLSRPKVKELAKWKLPETSVKEFRAKFGGDRVSDDEKILRYFAGEDYVAAMKAAAPARDYTSTTTPLVALIKSLAGRKHTKQIYIRRKNLLVRLERRSGIAAADNLSPDVTEQPTS
jgi:oxaloacetate decarboxylase (Na+ extruding) subunit alpha